MGDPGRDEQSQWDARVVALSLRQVLRAYREHNVALFSGRLRTPQLRFSEADQFWGMWRSADRLLELSLRLLDRPWGDLLEVLKHEMAHQYVDEVLELGSREGPHGPTFRRVCTERGIDDRTAGDPISGWPEPARPGDDGTLRRIAHLLSLAQSDNVHEAEAAMRAAQRLMLKHNLEADVQAARAGYSHRHVGKATGRRMAWQRVLGNILAEHFFVEVIIVPVYRVREQRSGSVLEICGTPSNLEIAAYVHDFLETTALGLWKSRRAQTGAATVRERNSFLYGVMKGFSDKLDAERNRSQKEGLVYVGDPALRTFLKSRHPYMRSVSGGARLRPDAFSAGHAAGGRIVLHRGVTQGQGGNAVRRLGTGGIKAR